ncbi:MAG: DNRLRE domain-containing protein [Lentisphaeria bacterium]
MIRNSVNVIEKKRAVASVRGLALFAGLLLASANTQAAFSYTTANGTGADVYVFNENGDKKGENFNGADNGYLSVVTYNSNWSRKTYLRFDTAGLTGTVQTASLRLDFVNVGSATTLNVYGLNDSASGQNWGESAITWNNAPGNDTSSSTGMDAGSTTLLGSFAVNGNGFANLSAASLATFLNADTDHLVTFILVPTAGVNVQAYSKDVTVATSAMYPTLSGTVPEPASALILLAGAGSLALGRRRRDGR